MNVSAQWQFDLPGHARPGDGDLAERWYPDIQSAWPKCTSPRVYDPIDGIRAVVIHGTQGSSSSGAVSVMHAGKASFHWLVPDENEDAHGKFAWACVPEARAAWHVRNSASHPEVWNGENRINHFSLGIEIVNAQDKKDPFSDWQVEMTARIVRYCWLKYPNLKHVVAHARLDPDRRKDPTELFPWERFRSLVLTGSDARLVAAQTDGDDDAGGYAVYG
ncbi:N-acetylmuramoyl-L-alanine amidase [Jiella endophytica]|uniref:N-acetylmuramoyl-L-alanine amidase n=1 Tax=Jiella endophytica TaxID=2558362 RepID=A0A4Y8RQK3_9HYPH|nr:N-acetylmuramoyl-L-alanine amidase [Jiella endophytica]TFF25074.1 N-acetylmuramoyl-L-alanine amidase [Jiella endophytica]